MRGLGYQIVTVPTEHYNEDALHRSIGALCDVTRYSMPQLRVGTLNVLISLSDELAKLNAACAMLVSQIEKLGREIHAQRFERSTAHWSDVEGKASLTPFLLVRSCVYLYQYRTYLSPFLSSRAQQQKK